MKIFRVSKIFSTLWGLLGLWVLLAGSLLSFFITNKPIAGILFLLGGIILIFLMVSGRVAQKTDYSISDLILRGILVVMVIAIPVMVAVFSPSARPYVIIFTIVLFIILILLGLEFSKAEGISVD